MSDTITAAPASGWYPDPMDDSAWRWWDGAGWSEQVRPKRPETVAAAPVIQAAPPTPAQQSPVFESYAPPAFAPAPPTVQADPPFVAATYVAPTPSPAPQPAYAAEPIRLSPDPHPISAPSAVVQYTATTSAPVTPAPVASAPATSAPLAAPVARDTVIAVSPSAEVALYDASVLEPKYPWEAAIAALEAEQRAVPISPGTRRTRDARPARQPQVSRELQVIAAPVMPDVESPSTPWIWMLAFSPILVAAIAGALFTFAGPVLTSVGVDQPLSSVAIGAVSLLPVWMLAGLDISALRRRGFTPPSVLWILLLTPFAYFLVRARALRQDGVVSRGPWIAYIVNLLLVVAAGAAAVALLLPLITAAGLNPFSPKVQFDPPSTAAPLYKYGVGVQTAQTDKAGNLPGGDEALWQQVGTVLQASWLDKNGGYIDCSGSESIVALGSTFPCFAERYDADRNPLGAVTLNVTIDPAGAVSYTEVPATK